jgi:hypothetical protein
VVLCHKLDEVWVSDPVLKRKSEELARKTGHMIAEEQVVNYLIGNEKPQAMRNSGVI